MLDNEERKSSNSNTKRNRTKLKYGNNGQLSSEVRTIIKNDVENDNIDNNKNNENEEKKSNKQNNVDNNISKNFRRNFVRRKTKLSSLIVNNRGSVFINNKVEETDILEDEDELTFRQRITKFFETHNKLFYIQLITSIISIVTFIYYIICTYINLLFKSLNYIDFFACVFYIIEHIINILLSHHLLSYIFSIESLLTFLIEIPPFFAMLCNNYVLNGWYRFINITRVFRLIKGYRILELLQGGEKSVNNQVLNIITILFLIVFIWAGIIQMLDLASVANTIPVTLDTLTRRILLLRKDFHHYIYFIIVSLTTVGYGEIIPLSILGKLMIVFLVIVILVVVPEQTSELINLSNAQSIYERKKYLSSPDISFVVLLGEIEIEVLKNFCKEFFDKSQGNPYKHIVILMNKYPNKLIEIFINQGENSKYITYLQGDPMNDSDLLRCDILHAKSCIIFTNKNSIDSHSSDHHSLLLAVNVKKFYYHISLENFLEDKKITEDSFSMKHSIKKINNILKNNNFRIFLQLNRQESCNNYFSTLQSTYKKNMLNDKLLVIESLRMDLLSKSCMTPGIISLISNLVLSCQVDQDFFKNESEWLREYFEGKKYEIIKIFIDGELLNYSFHGLAQEVYNKYHSLLIALEINYKGGSLIKLNPINNSTFNELINNAFGFNNVEKSNMDNYDIDEASISFLGKDNHYNFDSEYENNYINERSEINRKKIKVFLYLICDGKESKEKIQKLDRPKNIISKTLKSREKTSTNLLETLPLNIFKNNNSPKKTYTKSVRTDLEKTLTYYSSESDVEDNNNDLIKYLVEPSKDIGALFQNDDELKENYYTINETDKNYLEPNELMKVGINDRNDINNHVIICGMHNQIIHLILPLRSKYIPENLLKWIVILANNLPQEIHEVLTKFQKIVFIQGDPLNPDNLYRANINSADIAVILSSTYYTNNSYDTNEIIGKQEKEINGNDMNIESQNKNINLDEDMLDAKTLFIYKSIRKTNSSIKIITQLLNNNNIEFLSSSSELKKLYKYSKNYNKQQKNNKTYNGINYAQKENGSESLNYEYTPIYASGGVYLPSLIDKITGQMYHKEYLYTILKLILTGEKPSQKSSDKKLSQLFNNLSSSNLFLIPCESRNESYSDMFKRLLIKYKMISIALYRKNVNDNIYYVYTNPRKTTLIRDTDLVFVLSSTENILSLTEKNIFNLKQSLKDDDIKGLTFEKTDDKLNLTENENQKYIKLSRKNNPQFTNKLSSRIINNNKDDKKGKNTIINKTDSKNENKSNLYKRTRRRYSTVMMGEDMNFNKGKYAEIDNLQNRLDKAIDKLKTIKNKSSDINKDINNFVQEGINDEFFVYLNKRYNFNT